MESSLDTNKVIGLDRVEANLMINDAYHIMQSVISFPEDKVINKARMERFIEKLSLPTEMTRETLRSITQPNF